MRVCTTLHRRPAADQQDDGGSDLPRRRPPEADRHDHRFQGPRRLRAGHPQAAEGRLHPGLHAAARHGRAEGAGEQLADVL